MGNIVYIIAGAIALLVLSSPVRKRKRIKRLISAKRRVPRGTPTPRSKARRRTKTELRAVRLRALEKARRVLRSRRKRK